MLKFRTILLSVVFVLALMLTAQLVTAGTDVISEPSSSPVISLDTQEYSTNQGNRVSVFKYRPPSDECYDVPLREAASCRSASQVLISLYRSPLDECYDVPLSELASCRNDGDASSP